MHPIHIPSRKLNATLVVLESYHTFSSLYFADTGKWEACHQ